MGVTGMFVDKNDNVWVLNRPRDLDKTMNFATLIPPTATECCVPPPARCWNLIPRATFFGPGVAPITRPAGPCQNTRSLWTNREMFGSRALDRATRCSNIRRMENTFPILATAAPPSSSRTSRNRTINKRICCCEELLQRNWMRARTNCTSPTVT